MIRDTLRLWFWSWRFRVAARRLAADVAARKALDEYTGNAPDAVQMADLLIIMSTSECTAAARRAFPTEPR
jgi:hypothetical protein